MYGEENRPLSTGLKVNRPREEGEYERNAKKLTGSSNWFKSGSEPNQQGEIGTNTSQEGDKESQTKRERDIPPLTRKMKPAKYKIVKTLKRNA